MIKGTADYLTRSNSSHNLRFCSYLAIDILNIILVVGVLMTLPPEVKVYKLKKTICYSPVSSRSFLIHFTQMVKFRIGLKNSDQFVKRFSASQTGLAGSATRRAFLVPRSSDPVARARVRIRRHLDRLQPVGQASRRAREPGRLPAGWPDRLLRVRHPHRGRGRQFKRVGDERPADHQDHLLFSGQPRWLGSGFCSQGRLQARVPQVFEAVHSVRHRQD